MIPQYHIHRALQRASQQQTHREQHDRDGQCYSCEDGHSHTQDQSVIRVDPAVSVQQFRLHIAYRDIKKKYLINKVFSLSSNAFSHWTAHCHHKRELGLYLSFNFL